MLTSIDSFLQRTEDESISQRIARSQEEGDCSASKDPSRSAPYGGKCIEKKKHE